MEVNPNLSEKARRDYELVQRAIANDQLAFAEIMDRYRDSIFHLINKMVFSSEHFKPQTPKARRSIVAHPLPRKTATCAIARPSRPLIWRKRSSSPMAGRSGIVRTLIPMVTALPALGIRHRFARCATDAALASLPKLRAATRRRAA